MREILFRGKRKDNGEWVEGRLLADDVIVPCGQNFILEANCIYECDKPIIGYDVDEETVGQFTGLTDKNGKKIFEGDIVKLTDEVVDGTYFARVEFGNPNGLYTWGWQLVPLCKTPFAVDILHWVDMEATGAYIEVIGNFHDNPELLEGKK